VVAKVVSRLIIGPVVGEASSFELHRSVNTRFQRHRDLCRSRGRTR
jgi:hypothetical protein